MKPKLAELLNRVVPQAADKWEKICVQLIGDEHRHIVSTIRRDGHGSEDCCHKMFDEWLQLYPSATWQDIINALQSGSVRKIALAEELIEYISTCVYVVYMCVCTSNVCVHYYAVCQCTRRC